MEEGNIQESKIEAALERLIESKVFTGSERNIEILKYLVDCYLKKIPLKEAILEIELFQDSDMNNSNDGKVRVYIYNLRKKLDEYYRTEGVNEKFAFIIKKGQYNLTIEPTENNEKSHKYQHVIVPVILSIIILILSLLLIKPHLSNDYCWRPFFKDKTATICCIGDHFTVRSKLPTGESLSSYISDIDSEDEFEQFLKKNNSEDYKYQKAPFRFVTKMAPVCSALLTKWFMINRSELSIIMEGELSLNRINKSNIVFIGQFSTMDELGSLFLKNSKIFVVSRLNIIDISTGEKYISNSINFSRKDYVMVSYDQLTDNGKTILFFASNNDIGVLSAVKNFTNRNWLKEFYKNIPNRDTHFNALFEVKGIGRTDLECKLVRLEIMDQ